MGGCSWWIGANSLLSKVIFITMILGRATVIYWKSKTDRTLHHISPYMSRTLLVAHVKDGVELGKYKLGNHYRWDYSTSWHDLDILIFIIRLLTFESMEVWKWARGISISDQTQFLRGCFACWRILSGGRQIFGWTHLCACKTLFGTCAEKVLDGQLDECAWLFGIYRESNRHFRILL